MNRTYTKRKSRGGGAPKGAKLSHTNIEHPKSTKEYWQEYHIKVRKPKRLAKKAEQQQ